jgi:ArsR family transcriptional regulator, arsenate/arsenite/antimonite-responsive transcriptional repressor
MFQYPFIIIKFTWISLARLGKIQFLWDELIVMMNNTKRESRFIEKAMNAIADPCRLSILQEIYCKGELCCSDIQELTGLSQPTCSHHIKLLSESELIECRKEGRNHFFTLNKNNFKKVSLFFEKFHEQ